MRIDLEEGGFVRVSVRLVGSFVARPVARSAEEATWSEKFHALFFIRAQEPWRPAAGGQE